jgi:hypothetical protein
MLLTVFSIPSPPPIGTMVSAMTAVMVGVAPQPMPTMISRAMAAALETQKPTSAPTHTVFKSTGTLTVGTVTTQPM